MITRIYRGKGIRFEATDGKIGNFPMWTLGWTFFMKNGIYWFNGRLISKAQFDALLPATQEEIRRRDKNGTTISGGDISGEETLISMI